METPGGAMLFTVNNHSKLIVASPVICTDLVSLSDRLVVISFKQAGGVFADVRLRAMPEDDSFSKLACILHQPYDPYVLYT